ncbi:MAG TPA: hypothetical protein VKE94_22165, partial [Gemmataceae bacterium]|nr:hypothetical protein [Gemmataceae bacterium]
EAILLLAQASNGVPRLLNQAAHQALVLAHEAGAAQVDAEAVLEALAALGLEPEDTDPPFEPGSTATRASVLDQDCGPLLSLPDPALELAPTALGATFADDPGDTSDYAHRIPPKRPA